MTGSNHPAPRQWTDARIETDLQTVIAELGEFPSRAELVRIGKRNLWDAMRRSGGVERWRQHVALRRLPTRDEIAQRAYELYESGAHGDSVAHWLTAERELAAA